MWEILAKWTPSSKFICLSWFCLFAYFYPMIVHVLNFGQVDTFVKIYLLSGFAYLLIIYPMMAHVGIFGQVDTFVKIYLLNSLFSLYRY